MQVAEVRSDATALETEVLEVLDQRLRRESARPLAIALSGGGDSLALSLIAAGWARRAGRSLLVLTVDHRLQAESAAWTDRCASLARRLGARFIPLAWEGGKPAHGLPAAARAARHRLLAEAARAAGARVILMGHTADDVLESRRMRAEGATTPEPRLWSPSPVWPEGRGLFLLRPLIACRRADLRLWLAARRETWIEDPANQDLRFARARARHEPRADAVMAPPPAPSSLHELAAATRGDAAGVLSLARERLAGAPEAEAASFIGVAALCAAGTSRPPSRVALERLLAALASRERLTATMAGARIEADTHEVRFLREAGEASRGGLSPLTLQAGGSGVWDGRFEIEADEALDVAALRGSARRLPPVERAALKAFAPRARPSLPIVVRDGVPACLVLRPAICRTLALERLQAACGLVHREPA